MWLGLTVELLAGALPYNEDIVDFSTLLYLPLTRGRGFEMWLGSTVELLAGALPCNEEIVDFSTCDTGRGVPSLSSVRWRIPHWACLHG